MVNREITRRPSLGPQEWLAQTPRISDALKKGISVSVVTWSGRELTGLVCDREQSGLLLDICKPDAASAGYVFLPWTSIEQVRVQEVTQRRVKFLPS